VVQVETQPPPEVLELVPQPHPPLQEEPHEQVPSVVVHVNTRMNVEP